MILAMSIPCWLIPLLTGLICGVLGYLLGRLLGGNKEELTRLQTDLTNCKNKSASLQSNLDTAITNAKKATSPDTNLQAKLDAAISKNTSLQNELNSLKANKNNISNSNTASSFASDAISSVAFDASVAKAVFGKKIKENDLTIIEGIGPKIQELFHNHDVKTWLALSQCSLEKCQEVLDSGGSRFKMHKPTTWAQQADFAAKGKWTELKKWQDELDGGN